MLTAIAFYLFGGVVFIATATAAATPQHDPPDEVLMVRVIAHAIIIATWPFWFVALWATKRP